VCSSMLGILLVVEDVKRGIRDAGYEMEDREFVAVTYTSTSSEKGVDEIIQNIEKLDIGSQATKIQADLRSPSSPAEIVKRTVAAFGSEIHILVNNAGTDFPKPFNEITPEDFAYVYDLNVRAILLMTQAVTPHLSPSGRIINIGSVGARRGFQEHSLYCSSKAALEGLSRVLAVELGSKGHTVNTVNPGPVQTELLDKIQPEIVDMQKSQTPIENRLGTTDDIAQVVAFLAEENSRWITGQAISASGGWAMY
ncbi:MAG: hypothetical protein Q9188_007615, partial [Gyalolechia gomerana]